MKDLDFIDDLLTTPDEEPPKKSENITDADAKDWEDFWNGIDE
jgi:hypothetical protein